MAQPSVCIRVLCYAIASLAPIVVLLLAMSAKFHSQ
jgi:hypothetical protein